MYATLDTLTLLAVLLCILQQFVNGNLTLDFKVTKISGTYKPALNCLVGNTTYTHGEIFKLDCKTQCVCQNGRHACSSLCPKEQLPAPEDTMSCRSPRLVEVPGHCCRMWLCENPTADVYATCHNVLNSPWTPCSHSCGLGISTRFTSTAFGCNQLSNLRLCENRKCTEAKSVDTRLYTIQQDNNSGNVDMKSNTFQKVNNNYNKIKTLKHRIRKGHDCRNVQHLGPARIRLGQCVSRKLYRPKLCGRCHNEKKCCVPSVSTTIQVELLCPLNAMDPINYVEQQYNQYQTAYHNLYNRQHHHYHNEHQAQQHHRYHFRTIHLEKEYEKSFPILWDTENLEPLDQETLQSHHIQIENKFIAVEWITKCECRENKQCLKDFVYNSSSNKNTNMLNTLKTAQSINSNSNNNYQENINNSDTFTVSASKGDHHYRGNDDVKVRMSRKIKFNKRLNDITQQWNTLDNNSTYSSSSSTKNFNTKPTTFSDIQSDIIPNPIFPVRHIPQIAHHSKRKKSLNDDNNDADSNGNDISHRIQTQLTAMYKSRRNAKTKNSNFYYGLQPYKQTVSEQQTS